MPKIPPPKIPIATQTTVVEATQTEEEEVLPPETMVIDYMALERVMTELHRGSKDTFLTYHNVPWTLHVRKEVRK